MSKYTGYAAGGPKSYFSKKLTLKVKDPTHQPGRKCSFCGIQLLRGRVTCHHCGYDNSIEVKTVNITDQIANHKTHNMYRWYCKECNSRGVVWIKKNEKLYRCPACNNDKRPIKTRRIPPEGQYEQESIWGTKKFKEPLNDMF